MNRDEAKEYVNSKEPTFLQPAKIISGKQTYICPICNKGAEGKREGIAQYTSDTGKKRYHCFFCDLDEDIIGLWKTDRGITDDAEAFKEVFDYYGVSIDGESQSTHSDIHTNAYTQEGAKMPEAKKEDYTAFFLEANKDIGKTDYHRGISLETLNYYKVGYVEKWTHPKDGKHFSPRLIIPTSRESYIARDTRSQVPESQQDYVKSKVGKVHIFNAKALQTEDRPFYVVEGEIDALSIIDVGGQAIGLGSIEMVKSFLALLEADKIKKTFIIALDNDKNPDTKAKVEKKTQELEAGLDKLGLDHCRYNPAEGYKDANEALIGDREGFAKAVKYGEEKAEELSRAEKEAEIAAYKETSVASHLQEFIDGIADSVNTPLIPTGFSELDKALDGGLYEGLYVIGALSSLGKTTFVLQIADQIAEEGEDILIFSLEMARSELMAKSISRLTLLDTLQNNGNTRDAKTTRGITVGKRYEKYSKTEKELIQRAVMAYGNYADNIYINEGIGDIGTAEIRETIQKHISLTGKKPVVIVDYLQILAPADIRATDKQNTDKAVLELKRISRDFKLPVIGISSFNRENYSEEVNMTSFKESGAIEYGSDVLIGLQYEGAGSKNFSIRDAMKKDPRRVQLLILKNRNGAAEATIDYEYYKLFNYFKEA